MSNMTTGEFIRKLRGAKSLYLRELAAAIDIDTAILSKIERGERQATRSQILAVSTYFQLKSDELLVLWLSDKVIYTLQDDTVLFDRVLKVTEKRVDYGKEK
jgi:HTH-type transcriptional regulator, competence development regulator